MRPSLLLALVVAACSSVQTPRDLDELALSDSVYVSAESGEAFSGPVFRSFEGDVPEGHQLEGTLLDGVWHGELRVYHENGRLRYMGSLAFGEKCGEWIENRDADPPADVFAELKQEIKSLGIYGPCPKS